MEEIEITLNSWNSANKKVKPSLISFHLTNQHVIKLNTQYESPPKIILVNGRNPEDVLLRINVYDEKNSLFAGASYQLEEIQHIIKKDHLLKFRTNCQDGRSYIMWDAKFETRPLQIQSNPPLAINDSSAESPAIGESMPTSANTLPNDNVPITNTPDQRQIIVPKIFGDVLQSFVENFARDEIINRLQEENEGLKKKINEYQENGKSSKSNLPWPDLNKENNELKKKVQSLEGTLIEERQRVEEVTADLEKMEKSFKEAKTELQQRERDIIQLRKSATAASQLSMDTGIYPLDQVDPLVIAGNWRSLFDDLQSMLVEELDKQLLDSASSLALEQYRKLTYNAPDHPGDFIYSRHYSYVIIREISSILCKFSRRVVLNTDDGSFKYAERDDLVNDLMNHIMAKSNRSDFAKCILGFLASPNNIEDVSRTVFKELPGGPKSFLERRFDSFLKSLHQIVQQYDLKTETMDASFRRIIYKAIYTVFQATVIGDNFVSFWSDVSWDLKDLEFSYQKERLAAYTDKFNNSLETVVLPLNSEDICVVFTVFPGCLYVNTAGEIKIVERSQVVCCKRPM